MADWTLYVRDSTQARVGVIEDYTGAEFIRRFNRPGTWRVDFPATGTAASLLTFGGGIVAVRDGVTVLSGPVRSLQRHWDGNADMLTAAGPDDLVFLTDRLALPVVTGPPYTATATDTRTGVAETIIKQYVDYNAGPNANAPRRVSGLTVETTAGLGSSITGRARFDNLLELCVALAIRGGDLGFRIVDLQFQVYDPADLTATAIFSVEYGNLLTFDYAQDAPTATYAIAGGANEGTSRTFNEAGDSAAIISHGRIETFVDARQISSSSELLQPIAEALAAAAGRTTLSITPIDLTGLAYGTDYDLGDRVTVMIDGEPVQDVVREVRLTLGPEGDVVAPVIGAADTVPGGVYRLFDSVRRLSGRVLNLERR